MFRSLRRIALACSIAIPVGGVVMASSVQAVPPTGAFTCTSGAFQVLGKSLFSLNPANGAEAGIGVASATQYNAMGFNPVDKYLYAIDVIAGTPHVVKIGASGVPVDLGVPTGASAGVTPSFLAGDVDDSNSLVVLTTSTELWKINLTTLVASSITLSAPMPGSDIVYTSGAFYSISGNKLYKAIEATGVVTHTIVPGLKSADSAGLSGAGFLDGSGNLKFANYKNGSWTTLSNFTSSSPTVAFAYEGVTSNYTDAATCRPVASGAIDTVTYNSEGGSSVSSSTGDDGTTITLASAPTQPGYTFNGWFAAASGGSALTSPYMLTGSTTLYAQWTPNATDTVTYNSEGGSSVSSQSGLDGTTITLASAPTQPGYIFNGWFASPSGGSALTSPYTLTGSTTLYAQWTAVEYTVTFVVTGGTPIAPVTGVAGYSFTLPTPSWSSGCHFAPYHWATSSSGPGTVYNTGASFTITEDVTLYARSSCV